MRVLVIDPECIACCGKGKCPIQQGGPGVKVCDCVRPVDIGIKYTLYINPNTGHEKIDDIELIQRDPE